MLPPLLGLSGHDINASPSLPLLMYWLCSVSRWQLTDVWTLDHITKMHRYLQDFVVHKAQSKEGAWDFTSRQAMETRLAPYSMGPKYPHQFSYSVWLCGRDNYVEVVGKEGQHIVDTQELFSRPGLSNADRLTAWKEALSLSVDNVCQFVC
jgi:hypothetical protein